jgi:hypothetical protein
MTEKHDVTKSSNPDVQALLVVITGLAQRVDTLQAQVSALAGEIAALPDQFVVPGPNGEVPRLVTRERRIDLTGTDERRVVTLEQAPGGSSLAEVGHYGAGLPPLVFPELQEFAGLDTDEERAAMDDKSSIAGARNAEA